METTNDQSATPESDTPPPPAVTMEVTTSRYPFHFTGHGGEYFRLWIVNLFLTIVTLGIYSAWAKVRKKRYLYAHTWVADANFEYHGKPMAILKGRLIAVTALAASSVVNRLLPQFAPAVTLLLVIAAPWIIARSLAFNATNSSYRNIRFYFRASYGEVLRAFWPGIVAVGLLVAAGLEMPENPAPGAKLPVLAIVLTLAYFIAFAVAYPYIIGALQRLRIRHSRYGTAAFSFHASVWAYIKIYWKAYLLAAVLVAVVGVVAAVLIPMLGDAKSTGPRMDFDLIIVGIVAAYLLLGSLQLGYLRSRVGNLTYNSSRLDGRIRFISTLKARKLAWLYLTNIIAVVVTFGLAIPWATIRTQRYNAACLNLEVQGSLDDFIGEVAQPVSATGEELGEFFDIDLSL